MRLRVAVILFLCLTALLAQPVAPIDSRGWINKGVQEYKSARYREAVESFQKAVDLSPNDVTARLYLATAWMSQYIPGAESPENLEMARNAEDQFTRVLQSEPNNTTALASMASLKYQQALDERSLSICTFLPENVSMGYALPEAAQAAAVHR